MNQTQKEELERTHELKAKVWSRTAYKIMTGQPNPYEITRDVIESNKGRIEKALRLLDSYTIYTRIDQEKAYGRNAKNTVIYTVQHLDESIFIGTAPSFDISIQFLHDRIFDYTLSKKSDMDTIGFRSLDSLSNTEILYVYWHQEEYIILNIEKIIHVLPRAIDETRIKTILRAIIEQNLHTNFHYWVEKYLGIPEGSINRDDHFDISIRNFAAHGYRFSNIAYYGTNGFQEEYQHFHDYFEALLKNLMKFKELIHAAGGHDKIVESYRKEIIEELLVSSPLYAFQPPEDDSNIPWDQRRPETEKRLRNPFLNAFLLAQAQYFDYDTLYEGDTSLLVIDKNNNCMRFEETTFTPNINERALIEGSK
jgi:hypothetical protein